MCSFLARMLSLVGVLAWFVLSGPSAARADDGGRCVAAVGDGHDLERVALTDASAAQEAAEGDGAAELEAGCTIAASAEIGPREPDLEFSWIWFAAQLLPSPELVANLADEQNGLDPYALGLRWQITPLLISWSVREGLSRLRWFIVEPVVRHAGSFEVFFSPELLFQREDMARNVMVRGGGRFYLPLYHAGEYLSMSVGSSYYWVDEQHGASFEAGVYVLFGSIGVVTTWSPWLERAEWITTLNLRVF